MIKRMKITCNEAEKRNILNAFEWSCPFIPRTDMCHDDAYCMDCIERNIKFDIENTDAKQESGKCMEQRLICEECGCIIRKAEEYLFFEGLVYCSDYCRNEQAKMMTSYHILGSKED